MYLLRNLLERVDRVKERMRLDRIVVFEAGRRVGMGMPYNPATTDVVNICNISSEELPKLPETFAGWLQRADDEKLSTFGLRRDAISAAETYPRVLLGEYLEAQFQKVAKALESEDIHVEIRIETPVQDARDDGERVIVTSHGNEESFDTFVIATGHTQEDGDDPANGYFASPWPISKLLPKDGQFLNHPIGTLGASLSAFDVVSSLAHRHGTFRQVGGAMIFEPDPAAPDFRIVLHSAEGWLPHLQYEQREAMRQPYRHVSRERLLDLRDARGFLRIDDYFDRVCRKPLADALEHDGLPEQAAAMRDGTMNLAGFVEAMEEDHTYIDPFDGMRQELPEARQSLNRDRPIRWKEVLDDLMFTLNYHAEFMPADDHQTLRKLVMPFLMNVIAALPIQSATTLLALRDAGRLDLVEGFVSIEARADGRTILEVERDGEIESETFQMFVDCSGESPVNLETFPFETLVSDGSVRAASVEKSELPGIQIDNGYRVIGSDGKANPRIYDIAFTHALGLRPYSYGLQACNYTAQLAAEAMLDAGYGVSAAASS